MRFNTKDYQYWPSINGFVNYASYQDDYIGFYNIELGDIQYTEKEKVKKNVDFYTSGAVSQFYVAYPQNEEPFTKTMIAVHGCSSSPDKVLGITVPDYTNSFGAKAVERGYTVIAPYILNKCDLDSLLMLANNSGVFAYELKKIQSAVETISKKYDIGYKVFYGISFGAQLAHNMINYDAMVTSGSMITDYKEGSLQRLMSFEDNIRVLGGGEKNCTHIIPMIHI